MVKALRPKYVPYIVIGIVLIYLSLYGLEGFGLTLTGSFFKEDFDNSLAWTLSGAVSINPVGQLQLQSSGIGNLIQANHNHASPYPSQWTIEFRLKVDNWGTPEAVHQNTVVSVVMTATAGYVFGLAVGPTQLSLLTTVNTPFSYTTDNNFHVYTLVVDATTTPAKIDCYIDATKVTSWIADPSYTGGISSVIIYGMSGSLSHIDYVYVDIGLKPPGSTPPPPNKGALRVFATYQGSYVAVSVSIIGPESTTGWTTTDVNNPLRFDLTVGTYTVSGTYSGNTQTATATVVTGQTSDVTLNFGGTPPPVDGNGTILDQILAKIKEIFRTPSVKQLLLVVGAGMAGIGGLMFILPEKRAYAPPPPSSYH
jgi:hypothetical protein